MLLAAKRLGAAIAVAGVARALVRATQLAGAGFAGAVSLALLYPTPCPLAWASGRLLRELLVDALDGTPWAL